MNTKTFREVLEGMKQTHTPDRIDDALDRLEAIIERAENVVASGRIYADQTEDQLVARETLGKEGGQA